MRPLIVVKFGGTSLASVARIRDAAKIVSSILARARVVVVVSAMAKFTNSLLEYTNYFYDVPNCSARDTVLSSGEQITAGLFALALNQLKIEAKPYLSWQVPIYTDRLFGSARIKLVEVAKLKQELAANIVPVVAGFQGVSSDTLELTTLGRGGSDTTAVALAVALKANACYIYTDVEGICDCDPNLVAQAKVLARANFEVVIEMAASGAKVLHCRSVELAFKHNIPLSIKSTFASSSGTLIDVSSHVGDLVPLATTTLKNNSPLAKEDKTLKGPQLISTQGAFPMEQPLITSLVSSTAEVMFSLKNLSSLAGAYEVMDNLLSAGIPLDLVATRSEPSGATTLEFCISKHDLQTALQVLASLKNQFGGDFNYNSEVAKVSIVGVGLQTNPAVLKDILTSVSQLNSRIILLCQANLKVTFVLPGSDLPQVLTDLRAALQGYMESREIFNN